jgi:AraC-like DNA-binding protein
MGESSQSAAGKRPIVYHPFSPTNGCLVLVARGALLTGAEFSNNGLTLIALTRGELRYTIRGQSHVIGRNDVLLVRRFETLRLQGLCPLDGFAMSISGHLLKGLGRAAEDGGVLPGYWASMQVVGCGPTIGRHIRAAVDGNRDVAQERVASEAMLAHLERCGGSSAVVIERPAQSMPSDVRYIFDLVEQDLPPRLHLRDIAERFGISQRRLIARFRRHLGTTPHRFLSNRRAWRAGRGLLSGTIGDAAHAYNYSDQSHLTRAFKEHLGMSPRRFLIDVYGREPGDG